LRVPYDAKHVFVKLESKTQQLIAKSDMLKTAQKPGFTGDTNNKMSLTEGQLFM